MKTVREYSWNIYKYKMCERRQIDSTNFMADCLIDVQHIGADSNAQARRQVTARMYS